MEKKQHFVFKLILFFSLFFGSIWGWGQTTLAGWTFPPTTGAAPLVLAAECGSGTIYADGTNGSSTWTSLAGNNGYQYFGGTSVPGGLCGVTANTGALTLVGNGNNGKSIIMKMSTTGYQGLKLTYATQGSSSGYKTHEWSYSVDGTSFTSHKTISGRNTTPFSNQEVDFSSVTAIDDAPTVYIKLTVDGSTSNNGNSRLDNIHFTGHPATSGCITATHAFAQSAVTATLGGEEFQNVFETNNTSAQVYSSSNSTVATVNSTGMVQLLSAGTTTISVSQEADDTYCAVVDSYTLTVSVPDLLITGPNGFTSQCVGTSSPSALLTVTNIGIVAAEGITVTSSSPNFVVSNLTATTIAPNSSVSFNVVFTPTEVGEALTTITVKTSTSAPVISTLVMSGFGLAAGTPVLETADATEVSMNGAELHGELTLANCMESPVSERGFVYGVDSSPENNNGIFAAATGTAAGAFSKAVTGLNPAQTYYYKAYAKTAAGTYFYGTEKSLTTLADVPVALAATDITANGFTANWEASTDALSYQLIVLETSGSLLPELILSEYVEGSGNNKAIEIYNGTGAPVDLGTYAIGKQSNGAGAYGSLLALSGTLNDGETYSIVHSSASAALKVNANRLHGSAPMDFNGNDAVALFKNGTKIDEVGVFNQVANWGADLTLRRKANVAEPKSTYDATEWEVFPIDTYGGIGNHTSNTMVETEVFNQNVGNVTSFTLNTLSPETTYVYLVKAVKSSYVTPASNRIEVTTASLPLGAVWNGTAWSNQTGPDATLPAIIAGDYNGPSFESASLTVNSGVTLTVTGFVKTGEVTNNGHIMVKAGANFVQIGTFTAGADSSFKLRQSTKGRSVVNYNGWSSPLDNSPQTLKQFSMGKLEDGSHQSPVGAADGRFFSMVNSSWITIEPTSTFATAGLGYLIGMPEDFTTSFTVFHGQFEGKKPNTGAITTDLTGINAIHSFIGNPYPGSISTESFMQANPHINHTFYLLNESLDSGFINGYFTNNKMGSVPFGITNGALASAQALLVEHLPGEAQFIFTDSMRLTEESGLFNKAAVDQFWLEVQDSNGLRSQILLGFHSDATDGFDLGYDAKTIRAYNDFLVTNVDGKALVIDTHGPFDKSDRFYLTGNFSKVGNYQISLAEIQGIFANGQRIYVKDLKTGISQDLTTGPLTFAAEQGHDVNRFQVFFDTSVLAAGNHLKPSVDIIGHHQLVTVQSPTAISKVTVYDLSGRALVQQTLNSNKVELPVRGTTHVVVVAELADGTQVSKKVRL